MEALAETIKTALSAACSRSRADLAAVAERVLAELAALHRRHDSEHARLEEESSVGPALGPLGRSTMRTHVFAELQHDANAAKPESNRGARLGALEQELEQALAAFRTQGPDTVLETLGAQGLDDSAAQALQRHAARQAPIVTLLGKVREAQLHLNALYRDGVHGGYFERFALDSLDEHERRYLAPLGFLGVDASTSEALPSILRLVSAQLPVIVIRVCRTKSSNGPPSPDLPLPFAALAFSPQWTWLQTTWADEAAALPPLLAELLANFGRITGPAFVDVLACDSARQAELAEACGAWPAVAYFPGDGRRGGESPPLVRWSPAAARGDLSPAAFAWELLGAFALGAHFVELEEPVGRSGGRSLDDYLALPREERQSYFPVFQPDGKSRLVPADVVRYCDQLSLINEIWERLGSSPAEPAHEKPTVVTRATPEKSVPEKYLRAALERILTRLIERG